MVFRARCCNPIRGEKIVGYITRGKGVSVHAATCPNVVNLLYDPERRIDVEWDKSADASPYTVRLQDQRRRSPRHPRRRQLTHRRHQHEHPRHRSDGGRRAPRVDPHDGRDQRHEASRESDAVDQDRRRRAGGRARPALDIGAIGASGDLIGSARHRGDRRTVPLSRQMGSSRRTRSDRFRPSRRVAAGRPGWWRARAPAAGSTSA